MRHPPTRRGHTNNLKTAKQITMPPLPPVDDDSTHHKNAAYIVPWIIVAIAITSLTSLIALFVWKSCKIRRREKKNRARRLERLHEAETAVGRYWYGRSQTENEALRGEREVGFEASCRASRLSGM